MKPDLLYTKVKQFVDDFEQLAEVCEDYGLVDQYNFAYGGLSDLQRMIARDLPIKCESCGCEDFTVRRTIKISRVQPPDLLPGQELHGVFGSTRFVYLCSKCSAPFIWNLNKKAAQEDGQ